MTNLLDEDGALSFSEHVSQFQDTYQASAFLMSPLSMEMDEVEASKERSDIAPRTSLSSSTGEQSPQRVQCTKIFDRVHRHIEISDCQCTIDAFITPIAWIMFQKSRSDLTHLPSLRGGVFNLERYHFEPLNYAVFAAMCGKQCNNGDKSMIHMPAIRGTESKVCLVIDRFTVLGSEGSCTFGDPLPFPCDTRERELLASLGGNGKPDLALRLGNRQQRRILGDICEEGSTTDDGDGGWSVPTVPRCECRSNPTQIESIEARQLLAKSVGIASIWLSREIENVGGRGYSSPRYRPSRGSTVATQNPDRRSNLEEDVEEEDEDYDGFSIISVSSNEDGESEDDATSPPVVVGSESGAVRFDRNHFGKELRSQIAERLSQGRKEVLSIVEHMKASLESDIEIDVLRRKRRLHSRRDERAFAIRDYYTSGLPSG